MTIEATDLRVGTNIQFCGSICTVTEFSHIKPGKGPAFVRVKLKSQATGAITEHTFRPEERFVHVKIYEKPYQYLYTTGDEFWFMNVETYEQISLTKDVVGEKAKYLKENINLYLCEYDGKVINIKLPITVEQEIRETEPGFRGDTAQSTTKPAVTETGLSVYVPLFVEVGDIIRIDTRTGKYIERVKR